MSRPQMASTHPVVRLALRILEIACWTLARRALSSSKALRLIGIIAYPLRTPGTNMSSASSCTSSVRRISRAALRVSSAAWSGCHPPKIRAGGFPLPRPCQLCSPVLRRTGA